MEEEKKENVTTESAPVETTPVEETPVTATPVEEVKEEIISNDEDKVEVLDEEPIEMLEGASVPAPEPEPEPAPALAEPVAAPTDQVVIAEEPTTAPAPEPVAPPVVHKVEDSPIANAEDPTKTQEPAPAPEPKKEEPKVEEKKEEPKKEEKPKAANNNKLAIILMVVALLVGAGYAVKTFVLDAKPAEGGTPSQGQGQGSSGGSSGGEESIIIGSLSEEDSIKLIEDLIVNDSTSPDYQPIERIIKNTSVSSTDLTNEEIFYITYNKYFKDKNEFTKGEFADRVNATLADVTYTPGSYSGDCNDREFKYDEETGTFKVELLNLACGIEGYEDSVHDAYGYISSTAESDKLVITIGVFFGRGTDDSKEAKYFYDYDRNNPVADGVILLDGNEVDRTSTDFKKGTKYDITFNIVNGDYVFVKAEQQQAS